MFLNVLGRKEINLLPEIKLLSVLKPEDGFEAKTRTFNFLFYKLLSLIFVKLL